MRVYLDSAVVIYLVESVAPWDAAVQSFLRKDGITPHASLLTQMECRILPLRMGDTALLKDYEAFFASMPGGLLGLNASVFDKATELRAKLGFRTPDALHLAAAIEHGCDVFLTNDERLKRCTEIPVQTCYSDP